MVHIMVHVNIGQATDIESGGLVPNITAYEDASFRAHRLRMLGAKTTCKDRWRQIINEVNAFERNIV